MYIDKIISQIIEKQSINLDRFFEKLQHIAIISEIEKKIICQSLLGFTPSEIAKLENRNCQTIRDSLTKSIYPKIAELMDVEQKKIAGNWARILNFLLDPDNGYRLNRPPQLNYNNFQGSLGNQLFLGSNHPEILPSQLRGTELYQKGLYYQACNYFITAWNAERKINQSGNPEILIYINNSWLEDNKIILENHNILIYTIAIVVPIHHNFGRVATEILRGVAQIQLKVNLEALDRVLLENRKSLSKYLQERIEIENPFQNLLDRKKIALKVLIVSEDNNLYAEENQTARYLVSIAEELNIIAVIGHYSSEMTKKAVKIYADRGLLLITPSATSNELASSLNNETSFFRMTTPDRIAAQAIGDYLSQRFEEQEPPTVSIFYNCNSSYSCSFRNSIRQYFANHQNFNLVSEDRECSYLNEDYQKIKTYLDNHRQVQIIIVIPDGGIEPNSLQNSGLVSCSSRERLIVGSATLYHDNLLEWLDLENSEISHNKIFVCIPWHYHSICNGRDSQNLLSKLFCEFGDLLWGKAKVTWRTATTFDSVYMVVRALDRKPANNCQELTKSVIQYFRENKQYERGVTGKIAFDETCDRLNPPTEIVTVIWDDSQQKWIFSPVVPP